ncbi:hypothetical protein BDZ94DRAFT_1296375 [Collybia nuda]|uniref:DUF6533 domain-containing protein n=1 Tax=Collybia nuda TaxID=64659 RepID=A0A9P5YCZ2_9AGAR|nr:hypothetical protein BDZ94DRAFT_1296375 [Collybia nuda]
MVHSIFDLLTNTIYNLTVTKYAYVVSATLLFYDIFLTFDQEVSRIWIAKKSLGRTLFFLNRYIPPLLFMFDLFYQLHPAPSVAVCHGGFLPSGIMGILTTSTIELILITRTYALYQKKFLLVALLFLGIASSATMITTTVYLYVKLITFPPPEMIPLVPGCFPICEDPLCRTLLTAFTIPFFVLETAIFLLTFYKSYESFKHVSRQQRSHLATIIYRDGLVYYAVIISISITNVVVWCVAPISLAYFASSLIRSLQATICSRLLLNIRGLLHPQESYPVNQSLNPTGTWFSHRQPALYRINKAESMITVNSGTELLPYHPPVPVAC